MNSSAASGGNVFAQEIALLLQVAEDLQTSRVGARPPAFAHRTDGSQLAHLFSISQVGELLP